MQILLLKSFAGDPDASHFFSFSRKNVSNQNLSSKDLEQLLSEVKAGNLKSREEIFKSFFHLVLKIAKKYSPIARYYDPTLSTMDLIGAGSEGLLEAIDEHKSKDSFLINVAFDIAKHIKRFQNLYYGNIQTSETNRERLKRIDDFQNDFFELNHRKATVFEISESLGLSLLQIEKAKRGKVSRAPFDCYAEHLNLSDTNVDLDRELINAELRLKVMEVITKFLTPKERFIAIKYFGLGQDIVPWSYTQIGAHYGSTKQYVKIFFDKYIIPKLTQRLKATAQQYL